MGRRDKTKFEKWFSLSRHQRRSGAKELSSLISTDFKSQRDQIILGDAIAYTHGSSNNIEEHFVALRDEFSGQSELCYTHAKIIVLLRREFEVEKHFKLLEQLWQEESNFLLKNLDFHWLLSAAARFAENSDDKVASSLGIATTCLQVSVRLAESERFLTNAAQCEDDKEKQTRLDNGERIALFEDMPVFKFGTDDTIRFMRWQLDKAAKFHVAGKILLEVFKRLQEIDTVYKRAKDRHTRNKTSWW
jgi:hypothetical protein